jgi:hypothetical protein
MTFNYYETAAPSRYVAYEIQFEGYSLRSETDRWGAYIDNLSSPRIVYDVPDMRAGWPTSMGEAKVVSGTQIRTRATPNHQLKDESGVWHNWTPAYAPGTHGCTDPNFRWIWYRRYDDFYADGTVP